MKTVVQYHLLAQLNNEDTLDQIETYKTLNAAVKGAEDEAKNENTDYGPGSRFVIVEQKGESYTITQVGVIPEAGLIWQK